MPLLPATIPWSEIIINVVIHRGQLLLILPPETSYMSTVRRYSGSVSPRLHLSAFMAVILFMSDLNNVIAIAVRLVSVRKPGFLHSGCYCSNRNFWWQRYFLPTHRQAVTINEIVYESPDRCGCITWFHLLVGQDSAALSMIMWYKYYTPPFSLSCVRSLKYVT